MATRLVRAKKRIKAARIPFRIPDRADLPARMASVLEAVYGAYVIDWATGPQVRQLPSEALHLAEVLTTLVPDDPEARGLAALIELSAARAPARIDADGRFVPLADQDRSLWDQRLIGRAHEHLRAAHALGRVGRFQLEAAIQSVHAERRRSGKTDWSAIAWFYERLVELSPTLGARVGHAAAVAEVSGPVAALSLLEGIEQKRVKTYQPYWAVRAHLLQRLRRKEEARQAFDRAIGLEEDPAVRRFLLERKASVDSSGKERS